MSINELKDALLVKYLNFIGVALLFIICSSCYYEDFNAADQCLTSDLEISVETENSSSCEANDGSIEASALGGIGDYQFSIDGGETLTSTPTFNGLAGGTYLVIVFDANLCSDSTTVQVDIADTDFEAEVVSISPVTECEGDNGSIQLTASGGSGLYTFTNDGKSNEDGLFTGLAPGVYEASVTDNSCTVTLQVTVASEVDVSYIAHIAPILEAKCNFDNCHGSNSSRPDFTGYDNVKNFAAGIQSRTASGSMPRAPRPGGSLTQDQIDLISCWVDGGALNN